VHCIGDSFTFGWGVEFEQSYPCVLQQLVGDRYCVLNLGDASYGLLAASTKSRLFAEKYPADVVIWQFDDSDFEDDQKTLRFRDGSSWDKGSHWLRYLACKHAYLACVPRGLAMQGAFESFWKMDFSGAPRPPNDFNSLLAQSTQAEQTLAGMTPPQGGSETTLETLSSLQEVCRARNQRLIVVMQEIDDPEAVLYQFAKNRGIDVVVFPQFLGWMIPGDFHLNVEGNRRLAELVAARVFATPTP
jgi:hypothetical protein